MNKNLGYIKDKQEFFKAVKKDSFLRSVFRIEVMAFTMVSFLRRVNR